MKQKVAFLFPGQGSQTIGMLAELLEDFPNISKTFNEASDVLGYDLWDIAQNDATKLNQTEYTQPILLTASIAIWRVLRDNTSVLPDFLAGHSLGEYSALVAADALDFKTAVELVAKRGRYMQNAVLDGQGAMAVVLGMTGDVVESVCKNISKTDSSVSAVNFNSQFQVVIAGHKAAVEVAINELKNRGAKRAMLLPVSVPSHCALMQSAAIEFQKELESSNICSPKIPVIHNADLQGHHDPKKINQALVNQLTMPVRWLKTIELLVENGCGQFVECGAGSVLTGLNKRINCNIPCMATNNVNNLGAAILELNQVHV
ncbi:MAG: [acyl-carrier-protein] S-malonyltransferase [Thiotrichales bacterium]|nr:MAG: [acyl-carrier-protein] S-malonyltransferase [Thiotrichales bacterium]